MKRTFIAATIAALAIPVGLAVPAQADWWNPYDNNHIATDEMAVSVNNTWGLYDLSVYVKVTCSDGTTSSIGSPDALVVVPAGGELGEAPSCWSMPDGDFAYEFTVEANSNRQDCVQGNIENHAMANGLFIGTRAVNAGDTGGLCVTNNDNTRFPDDLRNVDNFIFMMKTNAGNYNLQINPIYQANYGQTRYLLGENPPQALPTTDPSSQDVSAANDFRVAQARGKDASYVTVNAKRMTAVAQRFVDHPEDVINIHGYGPDRKTALAKAHHIRAHLLSEITRLGGDVSTHPVVAIYAGDTTHKKGVDVTVHQHSVRSIHSDGS